LQRAPPKGEKLMSKNVFAGVMPALMTPCRANRTPDFDALVRKGQELVSAGMAGVIYCGSMGDWPLLTDEQRMTGVERLVKAGLARAHKTRRGQRRCRPTLRQRARPA
jgi:dihydrodipicolinate synthase/N-acetylneuraminate lyase